MTLAIAGLVAQLVIVVLLLSERRARLAWSRGQIEVIAQLYARIGALEEMAVNANSAKVARKAGPEPITVKWPEGSEL